MLLAGWRGEAKNFGKWPDRAPALPKLLGNQSRGRMGRDHSSVAVIDAANSADGVRKAPLGNVRIAPGARHQ